VARRRRLWGFSAAQKTELWARWKAGETMASIGRALEKHVGTVYHELAIDGGIVRAPRHRSCRALTPHEREEITRGVAAGASLRAIARTLARAPSTISREILRHGGRQEYRAAHADAEAWRRAKRPKPCRLAQHPALRQLVAERLRMDWAPQQIAEWLVTEYPDDPTMRVSHETIYRSLYIQARGVLKKELIAHLRRRRPIRRSRRDPLTPPRGSRIPDLVSIAERPAEIEDRALPGHWEGDLLAGAKNTHIATLVERKTRYVHLVRVTGKDTTTVINALIREVHRLPQGLMRSLTWDRGTEMTEHGRFRVATDVAVYFCDPQSPWQRGSNENTNGLLRQYFPKGMNLANVTQRQLDAVARQLNMRPRKTLGYRSPAEHLAKAVATIG
jgi:IS30 family transposase